jgi:2-dehydro-3-deoxyphosphooctonate aldolase (KDO 8-P synthase)
MKTITLGDKAVKSVSLGAGQNLVLMAGPCVIESEALCFRIAEFLKSLCGRIGLPLIFKASFDKANRSSLSSFRGPGLAEGLRILEKIRREFALPVLTDIHLPDQAAPVAQVVDLIQIPAFLCRQTDLLVAAAKTGKPVQVKKAQFMAPWDMKNVITKIKDSGNPDVILVERGSSFGYNRLVCDMTSIPLMRQLGCPVVIDATHSTQQPSGLGGSSGGSPELAPVIARAAVAAGADALFLETHPDPQNALSDAACMLPLTELEPLLKCCVDLFHLIRH